MGFTPRAPPSPSTPRPALQRPPTTGRRHSRRPLEPSARGVAEPRAPLSHAGDAEAPAPPLPPPRRRGWSNRPKSTIACKMAQRVAYKVEEKNRHSDRLTHRSRRRRLRENAAHIAPGRPMEGCPRAQRGTAEGRASSHTIAAQDRQKPGAASRLSSTLAGLSRNRAMGAQCGPYSRGRGGTVGRRDGHHREVEESHQPPPAVHGMARTRPRPRER